MDTRNAAEDDTGGAVTPSLVAKLVFFTIALIAGPVAAFFMSLHYVWVGNGVYAAGTAVVVVHVLIVAYLVAAYAEEPAAKPKRQ